jgi:hypothetical protein
MEVLPTAVICHRSTGRIRIRIPARRGDNDYFAALVDHFKTWDVDLLKANPVSGSLLISGKHLEVEAVEREAEKAEFFKIAASPPPPESIVKVVTAPIQVTSTFFRKLTGGGADLAGIIFLGLLGFGVYELMRGNFKSPPWYTAFWYAFGIFSKSLADRSG